MTFDPKNQKKGSLAIAEQRLKVLSTEVVMHVRDLEHARSDEVLTFCVEQLRSGKTYNELRMMLGCKPASVDRIWREIRECLVEMILPSNEEEALQADAAHSSFMLRKMEEFLTKMEARSQDMRGSDNEHHFLKLEIETLKTITEKYSKRTEHYLKMKDLQKKEKRKTGATIIFQNNYKVARPGDVINVTPKDAAALVADANEMLDKLDD